MPFEPLYISVWAWTFEIRFLPEPVIHALEAVMGVANSCSSSSAARPEDERLVLVWVDAVRGSC